MKIIIREATSDDLDGVLSLYRQPDMDNAAGLALEDGQKVFSEMIRYPNYRLFVAQAGQMIVGTFALLIMDNLAHMGAKSGVVEDVVVKTGWQNQGIGRQMMQFAMERCKNYHCYKMTLSSNQKREAAHRFYESLGFEKHGYSFLLPLNSES